MQARQTGLIGTRARISTEHYTAGYLKSPEDMAAYLEACMEETSPTPPGAWNP